MTRALLCLGAAAMTLAVAAAGCGSAARQDPKGDAGPASFGHGQVLYLAPAGRDGGSCTKAAPCRSLDAALGQATAGATVVLAAGRYPAQEVHGGPRTGGRPIVIRPAAGAAVRMGKLSLHASRLTFERLRLDGWYAYADAGRLTFRDVTAGWFFVDSASNLKLLGGSVGPADSIDPQIRAADTTGSAVPTNILIDGVTFHDFTNRSDPSTHIECLQFGAGRNVVVRNSRFLNCAEHSIFVGSWGGTATVDGFLFEDNHFGRVPKGFYSLRVGSDGTRNITVRHNSALNVMQVDPGVPGVSFDHNLAPREPWECIAGQRYTDNVWSGVTCSASDRRAPAATIAGRAANLSLRPGA